MWQCTSIHEAKTAQSFCLMCTVRYSKVIVHLPGIHVPGNGMHSSSNNLCSFIGVVLMELLRCKMDEQEHVYYVYFI
jgi:cysteinyl-tRNA synthetase